MRAIQRPSNVGAWLNQSTEFRKTGSGVLYVDDKLPRHPKIFKAGAMLGDNGPAQAIAMYLDGLSYAREHLTDGFIPDKFVSSSGLVQSPVVVAKALSSRGVRLWHRVRGGYTIHDYHHWNRKASDIKKKREAEREKKRRQREAKSHANDPMSLDVSLGDNSRTSRARASTYHVPRTTTEGTVQAAQPRTDVREERSTAAVATANFPAVENSEIHNATTTGPEASAVATALRDHEESVRDGDRSVRMERADQTAPGRIGFHVPASDAPHRSDGSSAGVAGETVGERAIAEAKAKILALPPVERRAPRLRRAGNVAAKTYNGGAN